MPFVNPYNFARLARFPSPRLAARGWDRDTAGALSGAIECELVNETALFVPRGDDRGGTKEFFELNGMRDRRIAIPATSLKGALRSLAEALCGGCSPFNNPPRCSGSRSLCPSCRLFGFLSGGDIVRGRISLSDAITEARPPSNVVHLERIGGPKTSHWPFYEDSSHHKRGRKFYWHQPAVLNSGTIPRTSRNPVNQAPSIKPLDANATFHFTVRFDAIEPEELGLLLWTLFPGGTRRQKVGYGKALGLGTIKISPLSWSIADATSRYTVFDSAASDAPLTEMERFKAEFAKAYARRVNQTPTVTDLFAIADDNLVDLDYLLTPQSFAGDIRYPTQQWFQNNSTTLLPTTVETARDGKRLPD